MANRWYHFTSSRHHRKPRHRYDERNAIQVISGSLVDESKFVNVLNHKFGGEYKLQVSDPNQATDALPTRESS